MCMSAAGTHPFTRDLWSIRANMSWQAPLAFVMLSRSANACLASYLKRDEDLLGMRANNEALRTVVLHSSDANLCPLRIRMDVDQPQSLAKEPGCNPRRINCFHSSRTRCTTRNRTEYHLRESCDPASTPSDHAFQPRFSATPSGDVFQPRLPATSSDVPFGSRTL